MARAVAAPVNSRAKRMLDHFFVVTFRTNHFMQIDAQTKDKHILVSLHTVKNSDFYNHLLSEYNQGNPPNPQMPIGIVCKREGCVLGIEPNEHQIPRFLWKYSSSH
jgi:hypothetical protein